jgi:hypothetical protein
MRKFNLISILFLTPLFLFSQRASGVPQDSGPLKFETTADYVIYIGLPILVVILYFIWKAKEKKEKEGKS